MTEPKKKKNETTDTDPEASTYPESASERRRLKAQAAADTEASCAVNSFIQSRLDDLKHVIKTPRQYPPASSRDTMAEKTQLSIGHFLVKQDNEKPKKEKEKGATSLATGCY